MIENIILEKPVSWIESNVTGNYVNLFYNNLLQILKSYNLNIEIIDVFYAADGGLKYNRTPEFNNFNTLYISSLMSCFSWDLFMLFYDKYF